MPKPGDDPYARAPDYPEDAEYFVLTADGTALTTSVPAVVSHADDDLDAEEVRRQIPDHAEIPANGDSFSFPAGEPIPELFVHDQFWKVNHARLVALDGEGRPLDDGRSETEAEQIAQRAAPRIADPSADADIDDDDPLAGLTVGDLREMEYSALRGLASATDGVDGNAARGEIEDALAARLREHDAGAGDGGEPA